MTFEDHVQKLLVIMRYISWFTETKPLAQIIIHFHSETFLRVLRRIKINIKVLCRIYYRCNGSLYCSFSTEKIAEGKYLQQDDPAHDTRYHDHDLPGTHQLLITVKGDKPVKIKDQEQQRWLVLLLGFL